MIPIILLNPIIIGDIILGDNYTVREAQTFSSCQSNEHGGMNVEDVSSIDTSFFCTDRFTADIIEKNIRQAIELASSKADACRRIMALEPLGYIVLSNVTDERKAALVNPFAMPKFMLTGEDFKKARNSSHSFPGK